MGTPQYFFLGFTMARLIAAQKSQEIHNEAEREQTVLALGAVVDEFIRIVSQGHAESACEIGAQAPRRMTIPSKVINM